MSTTTPEIPAHVAAARAVYTDEKVLQAELDEWVKLDHWLEKAKVKEMVLRVKLAKYLFADKLQENGELPEGTKKGTFNAGGLRFKAKVVGKLNRKILEELRASTMQEAKLTAEQNEKLVKLTPELSLTTYKSLSEAQQKIINHMIQLKPGAPELTIELVTE